ncbi:MAG: hypothetical protein IJA32_09990 [Lachnospiraceae bacterium]|nr:hypothetical protein [Lachnospiraceae bacterium]
MKKGIIISCILGIFLMVYMGFSGGDEPGISKAGDNHETVKEFLSELAQINNERGLIVSVEDTMVSFEKDSKPYVSDKAKLMFPLDSFHHMLDCSAVLYDGGKVFLQNKGNVIEGLVGSDVVNYNGTTVELGEKITMVDGEVYVPAQEILTSLGYHYDWYVTSNSVMIQKINKDSYLPERYDLRETSRVSEVRNQGSYGTCWAFASLGAFESSLMPEEEVVLSPDHMSLNKDFALEGDMGGEYTMAIAYLASWRGPVLEEEDPYGDGVTNEDAEVVYHLEDAMVLQSKDYNAIKKAVLKYGGVQTSIFTYLTSSYSSSYYYNADKAAYYFDGVGKSNHDVVIVGWDDNFPKGYFTIEPPGDGAFICKNSWGENFGEDGYFYVSYYDSNIGVYNVVYSKIGDADNYDNIYQSDLLGWNGQLGYESESAYFANVYETDSREELNAVSFYATGKDTEYKVYLVKDYKSKEDLNRRELIKTGYLEEAGYYTIDFDTGYELNANSKFAVVVYVSTKDAELPIAIEYQSSSRRGNFILEDGEGYISMHGKEWKRCETTQKCNVCLKAFTTELE